MNPFDNNTPQAKEKVTGKHIAVVAVLALLLLAPLGWMVYQQRVEAAAKVEAARVAQIQKEQANKAVAAMMVNLPQQPKGKKKMVKIARGTTGQADLVGSSCMEGGPPMWGVSGPSSGSNASPNGWAISSDGQVTVPANAPAGTYSAYVFSDEECGPPEAGPPHQKYDYEFEVVCVKINLSATKVRGVGSGSGSGSGG